MTEERSRGGSRILRHEARDDAEFELAVGDDRLIDAVTAHVERHVGPVETVLHEIVSDLVHLDVLYVAPSQERPFRTLVTCGMSQRPMSVPDGLEDCAYAELALGLPPDWPMSEEELRDDRHGWPILLLKELGRLPHEYGTWLFTDHTVPHGHPPLPYAPGTELCGAIIVPPLLFDEEFAELEHPDGGTIHFLGVLPLHEDELRIKLARGAEELYRCLDAAGVTLVLDPQRPSASAQRRSRWGLRRRP